MRQLSWYRCCLSSIALLYLLSTWMLSNASANDAGQQTTFQPQDNGQALVNPGMGWTLHFYSNAIENYGSKLEPSDTLDDWPGLSTIYLRVPWSFLEPQEGQFNWSLFDTPTQRWVAKGKKIAIRVSCCESWWRYATPKWVQDAGAKGVDFEFGKGPRAGGPLWEPDYLDPVFLEKLDHFLAALARHYDGNPNVAFIDIGSFGMWGEGHTGFSSRLTQAQTFVVVKKHIDLYLKHFHRTLLCISDDVAGATRPGRHFPETDYAISKGVTLRDDSILVEPPPHSWYHAEMAQEFWPRWPVILEHEHYGPSKARKAWSGDLLLKSVEDYHASYMSIHWWPREELKENRETIDRINRRIGYRLQLTKHYLACVDYPKPAVCGRDLVGQCGSRPLLLRRVLGADAQGPEGRHRRRAGGRGVRRPESEGRRTGQGPRRKAPLAVHRGLSPRRAAGHALAAHEGRALQPVRIGGCR